MSKKLLNRLKEKIQARFSTDERDLLLAAETMTDTRKPVSVGLGILSASLLALMLWGLLAPLDEGVPAAGTVTVESKRKIVQHLTGGIIKKILVTEAQEVKAGQSLVMLDDANAKANFEAARQEYFTLQAQADRLHAEVIGAGSIVFSTDLQEEAGDPLAVEAMDNQKKLFLTRRAALQGETAILTAVEKDAREYVIGLQAQARGKQEQLNYVQTQLEGSRQLAKEGYLPRIRWYEEERIAADLQASVSELKSTVIRAQNQAVEAKLKVQQRQRDYQKEVDTDFANTRRDALKAAERYRAGKEEYARTIIRAPVEGKVNGLTALTEGSVVAPGGRLMDIVPKDEALILEVHIDPNLIDRVHGGLPVDISLHAFANTPNLVLDGILQSVSADLVSDSNPNIPPYYLGRVRVTAEGTRKLGSRVLQPGMPAQITIKTGERTFLQYMLKPLMLRFANALKEA